MSNRLRLSLLLVADIVLLVLMSIFFQVWGFIGVWLLSGLTAVIAYFKDGGTPNTQSPFATDSMHDGGLAVFMLFISGSFGFLAIFATILAADQSSN